VTCSLDKTIKTWNLDDSPSDTSMAAPTLSSQSVPRSCIRTTYPVWRARHAPFGKGILSLAQRGETALEMYVSGREGVVERFGGHTDVVKEFVWRHSGMSGPEGEGEAYQLITWSKDRTLRFWPIDADLVQVSSLASCKEQC
jgi:WD repeat-containing protein 59